MKVNDLCESSIQKGLLLDAGVKPEIVDYMYKENYGHLEFLIRGKLFGIPNKFERVFGIKRQKVVNYLKSGILLPRMFEFLWAGLYITPNGELQYVYRNLSYEDPYNDNPRWPSTRYYYFGYIFVNKDGNVEERIVRRREYYAETSSYICVKIYDKNNKRLQVLHSSYPCDSVHYQIPACELNTVIDNSLNFPSDEEFEKNSVMVDYSTEDWQKVIGMWQGLCFPFDKESGLVREKNRQ